MTIQVYSLELEPDAGRLSVLPKAGLQRAADELLEANVQNSQILWESANCLFNFQDLGAVQNLESAFRGEHMSPLPWTSHPCLLPFYLAFKAPTPAAPSLPTPFELR